MLSLLLLPALLNILIDPLARPKLEAAWVELRWRAYAKDPALFIEECLFIPTQEGDPRGRVEFVLYPHQREDLQKFTNEKFVIALKARQLGESTLVGALALWRCLFFPGSVVLWMSNNQKNADKAVNALSVMWNFLPAWVKERAPVKTSKSAANPVWEFPDGMTSRIRAYAGTETAGASETASIVILDEFALVNPHIQEWLHKTADPTTDAGGQLWIISTARGGYNHFAALFRDAMAKMNPFVPIFHPWMKSHFVNTLAHKMPGCPACGGTGMVKTGEGASHKVVLCAECVDTTIYEAKATIWRAKPWMMHSEYPATIEEAFRESGNPVFTALPLEEDCETLWTRGFMMRDDEGKPEFVEEPTGPLRIRTDVLAEGVQDWKPYVLFADPAEGIEGDYTAAHVLTWDHESALPEIVAWWWANSIAPIDAAREFNLLGRMFHDALLAVENTGGYGGSMLTELNVHERYPKLYAHRPSDARRRGKPTKLGFPMSYAKRPMVVDRLIEFMSEDNRVEAIYPELRSELATFIRDDRGRMEADTGCNDDLVMSLGGGLWVLVEETKATMPPTSQEEETAKSMGTLRNTWAKIEAAREAAAVEDAKWERRAQRRAASRSRVVERRSRSRQRTHV